MAVRWYLQSGETEVGPLSIDDLRKMVAKQEVTAATPVRSGLVVNFFPAERVPGLFSAEDRVSESAPAETVSPQPIEAAQPTAPPVGPPKSDPQLEATKPTGTAGRLLSLLTQSFFGSRETKSKPAESKPSRRPKRVTSTELLAAEREIGELALRHGVGSEETDPLVWDLQSLEAEVRRLRRPADESDSFPALNRRERTKLAEHVAKREAALARAEHHRDEQLAELGRVIRRDPSFGSNPDLAEAIEAANELAGDLAESAR